jgi:hypothetical protein
MKPVLHSSQNQIKMQQKKSGTVGSCHNPSYSGGRDQGDQGSKPARVNSLQDSTSKNPNTKQNWKSGSRYRP